jgi:hypothetical protein
LGAKETPCVHVASNLVYEQVELARQIVPRHFVIGSVTAVRDWAAKQFLLRRTCQAKRDYAFQRKVGAFPIVTAQQLPRIVFDGDANDRDAELKCHHAVPRLMIGGAF